MSDVAKTYAGRILIIDDDAHVLRFYSETLRNAGYVTDAGSTLADLRQQLPQKSYDAVLLDMSLDQESGLDALPFILKEAPYTKVLVLTGFSSVDSAVEAMRRGASSYLSKDAAPEKVLAELQKMIGVRPTENEDTVDLRKKVGLVGDSPAIQELLKTIDQVKNVDSTVLILGESGTGKEVVARAIHTASHRAKKPFQAINCGAIPENLLESELFGHKKGSFTDAKSDHKGIFEIASDGTLLLDEIGDMPLSLQAKLLRVLQERQITPVGASRPIEIDTRVIAATNRDIHDEVKRGAFREDLFFRLSVVVVHIPPLRKRLEDIPLLANHFLSQFNQRFSREVEPPSEALLTRMKAYDWPGNIRELQNAVERGVVLAKDNQLDIRNLFQHLDESRSERIVASGTIEERAFELPLTDAKQIFEKEYVTNLLKKTHGNISEVARRSGRYRADIYRLMDRYELSKEAFR